MALVNSTCDKTSTIVSTNNMSQIGKLANTILIPKTNKNNDLSTSYSTLVKALEKTILPYIPTFHTSVHNTVIKETTLRHNMNNTIVISFNQNQLPVCTIIVALDINKAFHTVFEL